MAITTTHTLLTTDWTADVEALETAIRRFRADGPAQNDCHIALFEVASDGCLHVNVTHTHRTQPVSGWAGPASVHNGFVHNRTFDDSQPGRIARRIREVVFSERASSR
jgi:hypothetical protein